MGRSKVLQRASEPGAFWYGCLTCKHCGNGAMEVAVGAHREGTFTMQETPDLTDDKPLFINKVTRSIPNQTGHIGAISSGLT